jgi:hypothetical protein
MNVKCLTVHPEVMRARIQVAGFLSVADEDEKQKTSEVWIRHLYLCPQLGRTVKKVFAEMKKRNTTALNVKWFPVYTPDGKLGAEVREASEGTEYAMCLSADDWVSIEYLRSHPETVIVPDPENIGRFVRMGVRGEPRQTETSHKCHYYKEMQTRWERW